MKWLRCLLWGITSLLLLAGAIVFWTAHQERREWDDQEAMEQWMNSVVPPKFELRAQTLAEAVKQLNQAIQDAPDHPRGLEVVLASEQETKQVFRRSWDRPLSDPPAAFPAGISTATPTEKPLGTVTNNRSSAPNERYTANLHGMSVVDVIRYLMMYCHVRNAQFRGRQLVLHYSRDFGTIEPAKTRVFRLPWKHAPDVLHPMGWPDPLPPPQSEVKDVRSALVAQGAQFSEGDLAEYDAVAGRLHVRATADQLNLIETMVEIQQPPSRFEFLRRILLERWLPARRGRLSSLLRPFGGIPELDLIPPGPSIIEDPSSR
jgi:hypothetical protein